MSFDGTGIWRSRRTKLMVLLMRKVDIPNIGERE
jgi:hypothetical protein